MLSLANDIKAELERLLLVNRADRVAGDVYYDSIEFLDDVERIGEHKSKKLFILPLSRSGGETAGFSGSQVQVVSYRFVLVTSVYFTKNDSVVEKLHTLTNKLQEAMEQVRVSDTTFGIPYYEAGTLTMAEKQIYAWEDVYVIDGSYRQ